MRPRYVIINEEIRDGFEKEWHIPAGYIHCFVTLDRKKAIEEVSGYNSYIRSSLVVERVDENGREIIFRGKDIED